MNPKLKKALPILGIIVLAAILWYGNKQGWFTTRTPGAAGAGATAPIDNKDQETFNKLSGMLDSVDPGLSWIYEAVDRRMTGTDATADDYKIRGVLPRSGALLATLDAAYFGYDYDKLGPKKDEMHKAWQLLKTEKLKTA